MVYDKLIAQEPTPEDTPEEGAETPKEGAETPKEGAETPEEGGAEVKEQTE